MQSQPHLKTKWSLIDGDRVLYSGSDWQELEHAIRQIPQNAYWPNEICDLVTPSGQVLSVGIAQKGTNENPLLAEDVACVNHQLPSGDPPYFCVVGDSSLDFDSGGVAAFRYENGHWTEILKRHCVPIETMVRIANHFMETDSLPDWIEWEQV